jgi:hypothetical protein
MYRPAVFLRIGYFLFYTAQRCRSPLPTPRRPNSKCKNLAFSRRLRFVLRHLLEKLRYLATRDGRAAEQGCQQDDDDGRYSERIGETPAFEAPHQRREHEASASGIRISWPA